MDKYSYNVVREAEFVVPATVREYYDRFSEGYEKTGDMKPFTADRGIDERSAIEFLIGISHYLGMEVVFDERKNNAKSVIESLGDLLRDGFAPLLA
jgi:hypothetical protein